MRNIRTRAEEQKAECDRCGFDFIKVELIEQDGLLVCRICVDEESYGEHEDD
jgi:formylmethanofuran dehydrogenase subunit E